MTCFLLRWDVCPSRNVPLKSATSQTEVCQSVNEKFKQTLSECKLCDMI